MTPLWARHSIRWQIGLWLDVHISLFLASFLHTFGAFLINACNKNVNVFVTKTCLYDFLFPLNVMVTNVTETQMTSFTSQIIQRLSSDYIITNKMMMNFQTNICYRNQSEQCSSYHSQCVWEGFACLRGTKELAKKWKTFWLSLFVDHIN